MRVKEVMTKELTTVTPSTPLKEAAKILLEHRISGIPVVDGDQLLGVLSESDIVAKETSGYSNGELGPPAAARLEQERSAATVGEAMTTDPVTVEPWVSIWAAADLMIVRDVHRLPVVDAGGALVGLVTRNDLVRAFARSDRDVERDLRDRLLPSVGLSHDALDIRVEQGVATVAGEIDEDLAYECLRASVQLVPGVVQVEWHVSGPHSPREPAVVG
jgi:CBS domain-containing protein